MMIMIMQLHCSKVSLTVVNELTNRLTMSNLFLQHVLTFVNVSK